MEEVFIRRIKALSRPLRPLPTGREARLRDLKGVEAVWFDVYGTCFISGSGDVGTAMAARPVEALTESLREQGVEMPPELAEPAMERLFELIRLDQERTWAGGTAYPEIRILDVWEQWRREAAVRVDLQQLAVDVECRLNPVWPMPGLTACLEGLRKLGMPMGIISNAQVFTPCLFPALTGLTLEAAGFPASRCVWSWVYKEAKPSVRLFERALSKLPELPPEKCLYVGNDMRNDVAPAGSAGMKTALFAGDRRSLRLREGDPLVGDATPDVELTHLTQLLECV